MSTRIRISIIGVAGYAGRELARLALSHPNVDVISVSGSERQSADAPPRLDTLHPALVGQSDLLVPPTSVDRLAEERPDAVFLCTPHEASLDLVPSILERARGATGRWRPVLLDLSAAFRFTRAGEGKPGLYPVHYGFEHRHPALLGSAVYGLAELNAQEIAKAEVIAVPGCYPTSAILPLAPLSAAGAIDPAQRVIIDAVSGVSGAGRTPTAKTHFSEVSLQAYNVLKHRHNPEIDLHSGVATVFTPHLVEFDRGILSTIHVRLREGWTEVRVAEALRSAYAGRRFVRLLGRDRWPAVGAVRHTNFCDIGWACEERERHLIVSSAIDNLVKGAAGQALQCMNIRFGLPEETGLR